MVCNGCGKPRHIKSNCCVKLDEAGANIAHESNESEQPKLGEVINQPASVTSTRDYS